MFFQKFFLYTKMFKKLKKFISHERINTASYQTIKVTEIRRVTSTITNKVTVFDIL